MPSISKVRFTNVVYDNGNKRYIDTTFHFDGFNGILLLENGAGKTVFVQALIQAVLPHRIVAQRKIQETLQLTNSIAHIAVEWILEDRPRRYALTAVSLFMNNRENLASQQFAMEYTAESADRLETLPFTRQEAGQKRPATREEMAAYFRGLAERSMTAKFFSESDTLQAYQKYLEEHFKIIPAEWGKIAAINEVEGGVEAYFENCRTTNELVDRLLLPTVEEGCRDSSDNEERGNGFAELFEKQREHFKQQVRLQKRIEEMQGILTALDRYTEIQHEQYLSEQRMQEVNAKLKAFYMQAGKAHGQRQEKQILFDAQLKEITDSLQENQQALEACQVAQAKQHSDALQTKADAARQDWSQAEEARQRAAARLQNLLLAHMKGELQQAGQRAEQQRQALRELEQNPETKELQAALEENAGRLHGWFVQAEKRIQDQLQLLQGQLIRERDEAARLQKERQQCEQESRGAVQAAGTKEGEIRVLLQQQEKIEQELFPDGVHRDAALQQSIWQQEAAKLAADLVDYEENIRFYEADRKQLQAALPALEADAASWEKDADAIRHQLEIVDSEAAALLHGLQQWPKCANIAQNAREIYQRGEFFQNQLGDEIILIKDKEKELNYECRQAHRFLDLYGDMDEFSADPALEAQLEELSRDFIFLKSGAELFRQYSQTSPLTGQQLYEKYPFWASSVITGADELEQLQERLQAVSDELIQPVFLLTEPELRALLENGTALPQRQIVPDYWQNVMPERFHGWLDRLRENARVFDQRLQENQQIGMRLQRTAGDLQSFLQKMPFSEYAELQSSRQTLMSKLEIQQRKIEQNRTNLAQDQENLEKYQQNTYEAQRAKLELDHKLQRMTEYFSLQEEHRQAIADRKAIMDRISTLARQEADLQKEQDTQRDILDQLQCDEASMQESVRQLHTKLYYDEVRQADIVSDDTDYAVLADRRRQLQSQLEGCNASRGRIESELKNAEGAVRRLEKDIAVLREESESPLDEQFIYPENGQEEEERLRRDKKRLLAAVDRTRRACDICSLEASKAVGAWEAEKKRYDRKYDRFIEFSGVLEEVHASLEKQQQILRHQQSDGQQAAKENHDEMERLQQLLQRMERKNEKLEFAVDAVEEAVLAEEWKSADAVRLTEEIQPRMQTAEQLFNELAEKRQTSQQKKDEFIRYCENQIREEKMRRRVADGIRSKQSYEEFVDWKNTITNNIHQIIGLSESERKEHYEHIERMVEHMAMYLQEICRGLLELAAKTRIKVGEGTKDIYSIHIPAWKDAEARNTIRGYLNDITKRLDAPEFQDETRHEDTVKVKKELQRLLRTQQIMNRVLGEHAVKVKCRKATSAQLFSERPYSWEESNRWSGGEMWSKNMALFLGCLSYLAEKRCHVKRTKYNNRVVLADNPFGKASSDHVLDPVFFIAKELGFQLIALTAHEDGNFIRKYFPVVYSCRFANIAGQKGKVLQPEMEIKTAAFEELKPENKARLDDYEEMGLF